MTLTAEAFQVLEIGRRLALPGIRASLAAITTVRAAWRASSPAKDVWTGAFSLYKFPLPVPPYPSTVTRRAPAVSMYALGATWNAFGVMLQASMVMLYAFTAAPYAFSDSMFACSGM